MEWLIFFIIVIVIGIFSAINDFQKEKRDKKNKKVADNKIINPSKNPIIKENNKLSNKNNSWNEDFYHKNSYAHYPKFKFDNNGWSVEKVYLPSLNSNVYIHLETGDKFNVSGYDYYGKKKVTKNDFKNKDNVIRKEISNQKINDIPKVVTKVNDININDKVIKNYDIQYIYHMTHVNNLQNILQYGLLPHDNNAVNNKIDNPQVNSRRNFIEPIYNKNVHNYVPFYFNPKNAMLYVNKEYQGNLIILAFNNNLIYKKGSLFTDGNASVHNTKFYNNINDLDKLNWKCLKSKYWNDFQDGKRIMMSEVLVPDKVNIDKLEKIYCINYHIKNYIDNVMLNYPNIKVEVNRKIFF